MSSNVCVLHGPVRAIHLHNIHYIISPIVHVPRVSTAIRYIYIYIPTLEGVKRLSAELSLYRHQLVAYQSDSLTRFYISSDELVLSTQHAPCWHIYRSYHQKHFAHHIRIWD